MLWEVAESTNVIKTTLETAKNDDVSFRYRICLLDNISLRTINILKQTPSLIKLTRKWGKAVSGAAGGKVGSNRDLVRGIQSYLGTYAFSPN